MDGKLDKAVEVAHRVSAQEALAAQRDAEIAQIKATQAVHKSELDRSNGRNQVIVWVLGLIGAPTTVGLVLAGISKLFHIGVP